MVAAHMKRDTLELRPGVTLFKEGSEWCSQLDDGRVVKVVDNLRAGLLLLEKQPEPALVAWLSEFPMHGLLRLALTGKNARWIERAVVWAEVNEDLSPLQPFLADALPMLPLGSQRTRQRLQALLSALKGKKRS